MARLFSFAPKKILFYSLQIMGTAIKTGQRETCFILMGCDEERFHEAEQVEAEFQVYRNVERSRKFVQDFLRNCCDERILTDMPNQCGACNLQIPSLNTGGINRFFHCWPRRNRITRFRDPTEWGNHFKMNDFRKAGEWLKSPYSETPFSNSNYGTILSAMQPFSRPRWRLFIADAARELRIR